MKALNSNQLFTFMSKIFLPASNFSFPYDISLFIEIIQAIFSLLDQILGLENDKYVT